MSLFTSLGAGPTWPSASELPVQPELPDPLKNFAGQTVTTRRAWERQRRPELKALFQHYMYGPLPAKPGRMSAETQGVYPDFLGGKATLQLVTLSFGDTDAPKLDLMLVTPNQGPRRVPLFLALNFCGNHTIHPDPRIPLTRGWLAANCCGGGDRHQATDERRGTAAVDWPLETIIDRGYAFATVATTDIDSDRGDVSDGVYRWLARRQGTPNEPAGRGTLSAWAWGLSRCVDFLVKDSRVDPKRIAVVGHSRNGKTALLAAAMDSRIAMAIPHQAGCGGTAPSRGVVGESVKRINTAFPHWFNTTFKEFNDQTARLPFDQNCLVALVAPRPVLFGNAVEDTWANPDGQFEVLRAAGSAYRLYGVDGLGATTPPPLDTLVTSRLGYFIRPGKHSMTAGDWGQFLKFADLHLRP